jgi:hypothetical protein
MDYIKSWVYDNNKVQHEKEQPSLLSIPVPIRSDDDIIFNNDNYSGDQNNIENVPSILSEKIVQN